MKVTIESYVTSGTLATVRLDEPYVSIDDDPQAVGFLLGDATRRLLVDQPQADYQESIDGYMLGLDKEPQDGKLCLRLPREYAKELRLCVKNAAALDGGSTSYTVTMLNIETMLIDLLEKEGE